MLIDPQKHLGDSWYIVGGATIHCYYLVCPDTVERHTAWDIAHATSRNLETWTLHGTVLERGAPGAWDEGCLATGSVIRTSDRYLMAYSALRDSADVATGLAVSDDLMEWKRLGDGAATTPGPPYAVHPRGGEGLSINWRDPFLRYDGTSLVQLVAASRPDLPEDGNGTVAVVRLDGTGRWQREAPLDVEAVSRELECPQVRYVDGKWFLIFSAFPALFSDEIRGRYGRQLRLGTYTMVGESPHGPFRFEQPEPIVPANHPDQLYAGQVLDVGGRAYLVGTVWRDDAPDYLNTPIPLERIGNRLEVLATPSPRGPAQP
jgi:sucrose-6-phosphate hydrolase SacC (GH32 family)